MDTQPAGPSVSSTTPSRPSRSRHLIAALAAAGFGALLAWSPLWDRDWGWHLATFDRMVREGRFPVDDTFSYASQGLYEPVHWLFQLTLGGLVSAFGLSGVLLYRVVMAAAIGAALTWACARRGLGPWSAFALAALVQAASLYRCMERPHLVTTLAIVLLLDALISVREGRLQRPLRLPLLFVLWANAHPGVVFGVLLAVGFVGAECGKAWVARRAPALRLRPASAATLRRLALWVSLGLGATLLNPLGPGLYPYLLAHRDMQWQLDVVELRPLMHLPLPLPHLLVAGLFVCGFVLLARARRHVDPTDTGAALAFAVLALTVGREGPLALVVLAVALAPGLAALVEAASRRGKAAEGRRPAAWLVAAWILALVPSVMTLGSRAREGFRGGLEPGVYPVAAADWILARRPVGRIYNSNGAGGYLIYRLAGPLEDGSPGWQVYSDGRMPLYLEALRLAWDFTAVERRYAPEIVVLDWGPRAAGPTGGPLLQSAESAPGFYDRWALVHVSRGAKIYLRRGGPNDALIARHAYQHLRYAGRFWPGRGVPVPRGGTWTPLPPATDPEAFALEVARARRESGGDGTHLPAEPTPRR